MGEDFLANASFTDMQRRLCAEQRFDLASQFVEQRLRFFLGFLAHAFADRCPMLKFGRLCYMQERHPAARVLRPHRREARGDGGVIVMRHADEKCNLAGDVLPDARIFGFFHGSP